MDWTGFDINLLQYKHTYEYICGICSFERSAMRVLCVFSYVVLCLPDMCRKHWVRVPMAKPEAKAVANNTDETLAPTPAPAAAPHTINT